MDSCEKHSTLSEIIYCIFYNPKYSKNPHEINCGLRTSLYKNADKLLQPVTKNHRSFYASIN